MTPMALTQQPLCLPRLTLGPRQYNQLTPLLRDALGQAGLGEGHSHPLSPKKIPGADPGMREGLVEMSKDWGREGSGEHMTFLFSEGKRKMYFVQPY